MTLADSTDAGGWNTFFPLLYASDDGGRTWGPHVMLGHLDREWVVVDNTGGKFHGRVYINGTGLRRTQDHRIRKHKTTVLGQFVYASADGGQTWPYHHQLMSDPTKWVLGTGNGIVMADGTVVIIYGEMVDRESIAERWPTKPNAALKVIVSTDGGASFLPARVVSDFYMNYADIGATSTIVTGGPPGPGRAVSSQATLGGDGLRPCHEPPAPAAHFGAVLWAASGGRARFPMPELERRARLRSRVSQGR